MANFTILEPMSTGDVIDRAVRLYRRNFTPLVAIVSVPTLIGYTSSLMFWYGYQHIVNGASGASGPPSEAIWMLMLGGLGLPIWLFALLLTVSGLSRAVGDHLMMGEAITLRKCFSAARRRLGDITRLGLLCMVMLFGIYIVFTIMVVVMMLVVGAIVGIVAAMRMPQWVVVIVAVVTALIAIAGVVFITLMVVARVIFFPQVIMIEGQSASAAIGRAIRLGRSNSHKVGAILLFTYFVSSSLMAALTLPMLAGLFLMGLLTQEFFSSTTWTIFSTSFQHVASLLSLPIWMVSFTLLYFDSRVRKEAYDLELLTRDVAPGFYWQPAAQTAFPLNQAPAPAGQAHSYVQTGPLGLAGYPAGYAPGHDLPSSHAEPLADEVTAFQSGGIEATGEDSRELHPDQGERLLCGTCGAEIQSDMRFCNNCGSRTPASTL
ncbi:MAG TPA: zinc ribbon domain-containing protein [Blastocatellia bacterium]|jgi:hypothetical protein